jgi:hypothetical protein
VQHQPPELVLAEQVRERLAPEPALDQLAEPGELVLGERLIERGVELHARARQYVRE